jgi:hypothetical protein
LKLVLEGENVYPPGGRFYGDGDVILEGDKSGTGQDEQAAQQWIVTCLIID